MKFNNLKNIVENLIEATNLCKNFGNVKAVNNVNISLNKGDVLGFLGANGAGKTTTMRMIAGYMHPNNGKILIDNIDVWKNSVAAKRNIGYLPEGSPLYSEMTALQLLKFTGKIRHLSKSHLKQRIDYVIDNLGISSILEKPVETLSKGFRRRVGIAISILHDPKILILDEPTDGLDPLQKTEVRSLIKKMAENKAIIISTHIMEEVDVVCNKCAIISNGEILYNGSVKQLYLENQNNNIEQIFCKIVKQATS